MRSQSLIPVAIGEGRACPQVEAGDSSKGCFMRGSSSVRAPVMLGARARGTSGPRILHPYPRGLIIGSASCPCDFRMRWGGRVDLK